MIPLSTYRLQLNHKCTFKQLQPLLPYFNQLGISHLYLSPILKARKNSLHGYDVVDHHKIHPDIGTEEDFKDFSRAAKENGLSILLDIVPNHIFVGDVSNKWWRDVLKLGRASPYSNFFDIDWHPLKQSFEDKVFLPLLDEQFGAALENQKIQLSYEHGEVFIRVAELSLPTDPKSWPFLFNEESNEEDRMLALEQINGVKGSAASFNRLEEFLSKQHYRLCFWKVANDEINYRRFFDICDYAAIRVENKEVFELSHRYLFEMLKEDAIQGLRIDHLDGLWDPKAYLESLQAKRPVYVVVEKILSGNETLRSDFSTAGTVGYDFLNLLNGLFIVSANKQTLTQFYLNFSFLFENPTDAIYRAKRLILKTTLASELNLLARRLSRIAEQHRSSQDFSFESSAFFSMSSLTISLIKSRSHTVLTK